MKGLKIRIWDNARKVMFKDIDLSEIYLVKRGGEDGFILSFMNAPVWGLEYVKVYDFEVLLWTGEKDKNGNEIYEADVVRHKSGTLGIVDWSFSRRGFFIYLLKRSKEPFEFYVNGEPNFEWEELEVIGNMYENATEIFLNEMRKAKRG
jgi:hypothetical protein